MQRQALVIGLGQFGMSTARSLASFGVEVIAVDAKQSRVDEAADFCADALCFDARDPDLLASTVPGSRDLCLCAVGDEAREANILITAMLREMGGTRIIARATDPLHARILNAVGAHEVVNPEAAFGQRLAARLAHRGILDEVDLGDGLVFTELAAPAAFVGRALVELALPERHGVTVVGLRHKSGAERRFVKLDPRRPLSADDTLLIVAPAGAVHDLTRRV